MKLTHLSASRIQTFEQCQRKYHARYELNLPEPESHPNTILGEALHEMFERATQARLSGSPESQRDPTYYLGEMFQKHQVKTSLTDVAVQMIADANSWGYWRNVHRCTGTEIEFDFGLDDGTRVKGIIDRLDTWDGKADIIDLKTGNHFYSDEEFANNWQARIYNIAARVLDGSNVTDDATVSFWFLRHQVRKVIRSADDADRDTEGLLEVAKQIRECTDPTYTKSGLCKWCPAYKTCPAVNGSVRQKFEHRIGKRG